MHMTVADALRRAEKLYGDDLAIIDGDLQRNYRELADRCRRLAGGLQSLGVKPGDRVATLMANSHRYLEIYFAVPGMGAVLVPLNNRHAIAEHRHILEDCGAALLIVDDALYGVVGELTLTEMKIVRAPAEFEELVASGAPVRLGKDISEDALACLFYTGGTTGTPKGVMLTHRNLVSNALHTALALEYAHDDVFLHVAPMFHLGDGASTYAVTWVGGRHTFLAAFDPEEVMRMVAETRTTVLMLVPTTISSLIDHPAVSRADLSSIRIVLHGAAPIAEDLLSKAIRVLGCSFAQGYGMTEASPMLTVLANEERLVGDVRLRSAGREIVGVEVKVVRPDGAACAPGEVGEVVARGPNITQGYWNKPQETAHALRDGWFWSGDLAYQDEQGYLYLVDRAKDMIISGGENVYSIEVETVIAAHPSVSECAVIGLPDARWGERVHAVLVFRSGQSATLEELQAFCADRIAGYKFPKSIESREALPRSGAGKILKHLLRRPAHA